MDLTAGPIDHEQVVFCQDRGSGLRAIIAIHDTTLGPSLGDTVKNNLDTINTGGVTATYGVDGFGTTTLGSNAAYDSNGATFTDVRNCGSK